MTGVGHLSHITMTLRMRRNCLLSAHSPHHISQMVGDKDIIDIKAQTMGLRMMMILEECDTTKIEGELDIAAQTQGLRMTGMMMMMGIIAKVIVQDQLPIKLVIPR